VAVASASLASGPGDDPLAVLELELRGVLTSPPDGLGLDHHQSIQRSALDPLPRPLSAWLAGGGTYMAARAAFLAEEGAADLVAAALRPPRPRRCAVTVGAHALSAAPGGLGPAPSNPREVDRTGTADDASPAPMLEWSPTPAAAEPSAAASAALGAFGAVHTVGCPVSGPAVVAAVCFPVNLVAAIVGATAGAAEATRAGAPAGADAKTASEAQRAWEARDRIWDLPLSAALERQRVPARFAAAMSRAGRRLDARVVRVRLVAAPSREDAATLELELVDPRSGAAGAARWLCLRGPGPIKLWDWIRDEGKLLGNVLDAQLARAVSLIESPPSGGPEEGRCDAPGVGVTSPHPR
jgi:hypothetical protein